MAHEDFKLQVLHLMANLYSKHPRLTNIGAAEALEAIPDRNDPSFEDTIDTVQGTVTWLHRNGYVTGNLSNSVILGAQLSPGVLLLLQSYDSNVGVLGDAITSSVAPDANPGHVATVADRLVYRLLNG